MINNKKTNLFNKQFYYVHKIHINSYSEKNEINEILIRITLNLFMRSHSKDKKLT